MSTYVPIQAITLSANASSVDFTGIPATFTDLRLVVLAGCTAAGDTFNATFNGDTTTNYSQTELWGNGTTASSNRRSSQSSLFITGSRVGVSASIQNMSLLDILNYSNNTTNKTVLMRQNDASTFSMAAVGLWRKTPEIISSIKLTSVSGNFTSGSTFTLYGIGSGAPKAFGGDIVKTDGTHWYHAFTKSGTFTPIQSIAAEFLVIGGGSGGSGGTGGVNYGSAGSSGILRFSSQTISSSNVVTITVGAGGSANSNGISSSISGSGVTTVTATGGTAPGTGRTGGSNTDYSGGTGSGGFASGGGAGAAGNGSGSDGGTGSSAYSTWATVTSTGVSGLYGGGGAGATSGNVTGTANGGGGLFSSGVPTAGTANTGGGGGGGNTSSQAAGGSGIVIVRYAV